MVPPNGSATIVSEFIDVFPNDLSSILLDNGFDFGIDLELGTHPISIPPCRISPIELKKSKS